MRVFQTEGSRPVRLWTEDIEPQAMRQVMNTATLPFVHPHGVAIMPDAHHGIGSTVGSVIPTVKAIIPAAVGVDIGCVDGDTEFLTPEGWKRIADYSEDLVAQYDQDTGVAEFVSPTQFVVRPATYFWGINTKYGVDQMLSGDHRVLYRKTCRPGRVGELSVICADALAEHHDLMANGFRGKFLTTFTMRNASAVPLSDALLRVAVMVAADGNFDSRKTQSKRCVLQVVKERKAARAADLLATAGIQFNRADIDDARGHVFRFVFDAPLREKSLGAFWAASPQQLQVITSEVLLWDGSQKEAAYYTRDRASADFVHYAFSACGFRGVLLIDQRTDGQHYRVFANENLEVGIAGTPKTPITRHVAKPGQMQYCFVVPSSFWIMRRGGNIAITGNCGMNALKLDLTASQLPDSLNPLRSAIEKAVPLGTGGRHQKVVGNTPMFPSFRFAEMLEYEIKSGGERIAAQLGTLGSGNHFIELCIDENQDVWIMLHSGSRGIGNKIGQHYIAKAKRVMEAYHIKLPDDDLAFFPEGSVGFEEYVEAVKWAQDYALENRRIMMLLVYRAVEEFIGRSLTAAEEAINCHHNYVEMENHFGRNVYVTRKGAIRARAGDLGIIPGSMGTRSYIVRGKGNPDSYCSCSHGAGRAMSRTAARKRFTLDDLAMQTAGVECRKDIDVLDELPGAYKDIDVVMENQKDLVEIVHTLKQVMCVKGN